MRKLGQHLRRGRRLAVQLLALMAFVGALATSGTAYAFCPHAQRVMQNKARCCGGKHQRAQKPRPTQIERQGCCEIRNIDVLPAADSPVVPTVVAPPVAEACFELTALPAPREWPRVAPSPPRQAVPIRAGPQSAAERCVLLQTFLR